MKKLLILIFSVVLIIPSVHSEYNTKLNKDPVFMELVYSFIHTEDITDGGELSYCEQVYLEATRRREYTKNELILCGDYFTQKNNEEKAYKNYMFNNRELFY